jgi:hypothetical protein
MSGFVEPRAENIMPKEEYCFPGLSPYGLNSTDTLYARVLAEHKKVYRILKPHARKLRERWNCNSINMQDC